MFTLEEQMEIKYLAMKRLDEAKRLREYVIKKVQEGEKPFNEKDIKSADREISILESIIEKIKDLG